MGPRKQRKARVVRRRPTAPFDLLLCRTCAPAGCAGWAGCAGSRVTFRPADSHPGGGAPGSELATRAHPRRGRDRLDLGVRKSPRSVKVCGAPHWMACPVVVWRAAGPGELPWGGHGVCRLADALHDARVWSLPGCSTRRGWVSTVVASVFKLRRPRLGLLQAGRILRKSLPQAEQDRIGQAGGRPALHGVARFRAWCKAKPAWPEGCGLGRPWT